MACEVVLSLHGSGAYTERAPLCRVLIYTRLRRSTPKSLRVCALGTWAPGLDSKRLAVPDACMYQEDGVNLLATAPLAFAAVLAPKSAGVGHVLRVARTVSLPRFCPHLCR